MDYSIEEIKGFRVVGLKRKYNCTNGENFQKIPMFWQEIMGTGEWNNILTLMEGKPSGVLGVCANFVENHLDYYIAVASNKEVPENMDELFIETQNYAVFTCTMEELQETTKRIFGEWLPNSEYKYVENAPNFEIYPDENSCKICVPIKK